MLVRYAADVVDSLHFNIPKDQYGLVAEGGLRFRDCIAGERVVGGECVECNVGFYLLEYDEGAQTCNNCPFKANTCFGSGWSTSAE